MKPKFNINQVATAVMDHYLETGKPATVADISVHVGCSDSTARRIINNAHGAPDRCTFTRVEKTVYSRDYPMMSVGVKYVEAWLPDRAWLRDLLLDAQRMD